MVGARIIKPLSRIWSFSELTGATPALKLKELNWISNSGRVNLSGADMSGANFHEAYITKSNLNGTNLMGIKYDKSILVHLAESDMRSTKISEDLRNKLKEYQSAKQTGRL